jgi:hypothetical protein
MSYHTPKVEDVIVAYVTLPISLVSALLGVEEIQQDLLYPFKILISNVSQLTNYLGRVL